MKKQKLPEDELAALLRQTLDSVAPDEETKARMLQRVQEGRAAVQPTESAPQKRRIFWHTPLVAAGALLCAAVLMVAVYAKIPRGGEDRLAVEPAVTTLAATAGTSAAAAQTTATAAQTTADTTAQTTARATTATTASAETAATTSDASKHTSEKIPAPPAVYIETTSLAAQTTKSVETTVAAIKTTAATEAPVTTAKTAAATTSAALAAQTTEPVETTLATTKTTAATQTTPLETSPGLRRDIYQYYRLIWNDAPYDTEYVTVDSRAIGSYIGLAVTNSPEADDTYVVLVYSISGMDTSEVLAVQYANTNTYYLFRRMA